MLNAVNRPSLSVRYGEQERRASRISLPYASIPHLFAAADALWILVASVVAAAGYNLAAYGWVGDLQVYLGLGLISAPAYVLIAKSSELYALNTIFSRRREYARIATSWIAVVLLFATAAFLLKAGASF